MTNQYRVDRRLTDDATKRTPQQIDRVEDECGPAPQDTRDPRPDDLTETAQPESPQPIIFPTCDENDIRTQPAAGSRMDGDASQVIVTAGATANSVQVHHPGIPELHSHGESPESATVNLAQDLARQIDGAADDLHREPLQRALDDVNASIEQSVGPTIAQRVDVAHPASAPAIEQVAVNGPERLRCAPDA